MSNNRNENLSYGLNARNKKKKKGLTGFGGDDSDDSTSDNNGNGGDTRTTARGAINREIAAEQAALRKRAEAAMAASMESNVYDYDAEYDSFSSGKKKAEAEAAAKAKRNNRNDGQPKAKVQPRYITGLLKTAERRNQEQEVIYERKVQKEQAEEDADMQYEGKDKFITSSYKRKLEERERWAKEEKERAKREEEEDVTKKKGAGSFMFGGIGRSMLMGNGDGKNSEDYGDGGQPRERERGDEFRRNEAEEENSNGAQRRGSSSRETERWGSSKRNRELPRESELSYQKRPSPASSDNGGGIATTNSTRDEDETNDPQNAVVKSRQQILAERAIKIREARERYFKRRGVATQ